MSSGNKAVVALFVLLLGSAVTNATPTLGVNPATISTEELGTVQIDVGSVVGATVVLRLYVDANSNGVIDPPADYVVWTDVVADNVADWSPNMFSDTDGAVGAVTVNVRNFSPFGFPYTAGDFIWEAEDSVDASTAAFSVTQAAQTQSISGTATDSSSMLGLAGAFVVLLPYCEAGDEDLRIYSVFADHNGDFVIQVPADVECRNRIVLAAKPGFVTAFGGQPNLVFDGSSQFTNQDPELSPGTWAASGSVEYSTGPLAGSGIPGAFITTTLAEGLPEIAVAFTDENGDYTFMLNDGTWDIEPPEDGIDTRGAVFVDGGESINIAGAPLPAPVPTITLPAANAYFEGTLFDDNTMPVAGRFVSADRGGACDPDCYFSSTVTRSDGTFSVGVVAPASPAMFEYTVGVDGPLPGLVGEQIGCGFISAGETLTGQDLFHHAPTNFISGTMLDSDGQPLAGHCLEARAFPGCTSYVSAAVTACDGSYSLAVIDGNWNVEARPDDFATLYEGLAPGSIRRNVDIAGVDATDVDFIVGPWRDNPNITQLQPSQVVVGSQMIVAGYGFGSTPQVLFDATPAAVLGYRPDLGGLIVEVPGSLGAGSHTITVVNTDSGVNSDPACLEIGAGPYTPVCSIMGTVTDGGGAVAGALVFAEIDNEFVRAAVTDGSGDYSIGLDAAGDYSLEITPPVGTNYIDADYVVTCGSTQDHLFVSGWQLTGQVIDDNFEGIAEMSVIVNEISGPFSELRFTDGDGFFTINAPTGSSAFAGFSGAPIDTRFVPTFFGIGVLGGDTDFGQILAGTGSIFSGAVVDAEGNGTGASVAAFRRSDGVTVTPTVSDTCDGRFNVAVPDDEYGLDIQSTTSSGLQSSKVQWFTANGDQAAEFDFKMFDEASLAPATSAPRITFVDPAPRGQQGQPLRLFSANLAGTIVDVLFSDGIGGFVNGTATLADAERGLLVTKIPAGTASGSMKIRVDGLDSPTVPFTLEPGMFSPGGLSVDGAVSGTGVAGTLVAVFSADPSAGCTDEDGILVDYGVADGGGMYGPLAQPGGEILVAFVPPAGTMLTNAIESRSGVVANQTVNVTLVNGIAVTVRALDDLMSPLENAEFWFENDGDLSDARLTDSNGDATLYVPAGDTFLGLVPPAGSRLIQTETEVTIGAPIDLGNAALERGVIVGSAVLRESDGSPVGGALVEAQRSEDPFDFFHETFSGTDGGFHGPVAGDAFFQIQGLVFDDLLTDFFFNDQSDPVSDGIIYPAFAAAPAGFVAGLVEDAGTMAPLADITIIVAEEDPMSPGVPGPFSGFARTCPDGTYRVKLPVGDHFIQYSDFEFGLYASEWYPDAVCVEDATTLAVTEGNTTTADAGLVRVGTISGIVLDNGVPHAGATVCASSIILGGCTVVCSSQTDGTGLYSLPLPPTTDYVVQAFSPMLGVQCYDGDNSCISPTPVIVVAATDTPNIDFNFGCSMSDLDMDGVTGCGGDCDDGDPNNYPGNAEVCDSLDNDCDFLVDDADPGIVGQSTWYADVDGDGAGDPTVMLQSCAMPMGFVANADDCAPGDANVYSGAPEINDGADNQCSGDPGFGLLDEISGVAGFFNPADDNEFSWPAQSGATMYKVARSSRGDFSDASTVFTTAATLWNDPTIPASGAALYYLARSLTPFEGSWGQDTAGIERAVNVLVNGDMEDWTTPTNLAAWIETTVSGPVEQEVDPAQIIEGDFAARLTRSGSGVLGLTGRNVPLAPGQDYALSFAAKFDRIEANAVQVRVFNFTTGEDLQSNGSWAVGQHSFNFALTTGYQNFSIPFTVDAGFAPTDEIRLILRHRFTTAVGTVLWLDDVRIEE